MSEDYEEGLKEAKACKICGGYYPGDCECSPCIGGDNGQECDGCQEWAYMRFSEPYSGDDEEDGCV